MRYAQKGASRFRLVDETLASLLASSSTAAQPPLASLPDEELTVVLPSFALGGAERIVVDWAARTRGRWRVHVAVLREVAVGHGLPEDVRLSRIGSSPGALEAFARTLSKSPVVLCHLLTAAQRAGLRRGGAIAVPVVHNARAGWIDKADELRMEPLLVAVSRACADELRVAGVTGAIHVIRHVPEVRAHDPAARARWRIAWGIRGRAKRGRPRAWAASIWRSTPAALATTVDCGSRAAACACGLTRS